MPGEWPIVHFLCLPKENEPPPETGTWKERAPSPLVLRTTQCFSSGPVAQKLGTLKQFARLLDPFCDARLQGDGSGRVPEIAVLFLTPSGRLLDATRSAGARITVMSS